MSAERTQTSVDWRDGDVPVSRRFGDLYFSAVDGLAETRHVFLDGNDLSRRFIGTERFSLAELGFGTGLSFLAAWERWRALAAPEGVLQFTSFEVEPLSRGEMARALGRWPELGRLAEALLSVWRGGGVVELEQARLEVVVGDARRTVPRWGGLAEAWFLDGFAPSRNPELWEQSLMREVFAHTEPSGSFATYSAAGAVRRALSAAGFRVLKRPGFGTKRDMSIGHRPAEPA